MSLLVLLNPKQYGGTVEARDTSDILDVYRKKKREYDKLEEAIAAQLLQKRRTDLEIPKKVDLNVLANVLQDKLQAKPKTGEVEGVNRVKRIRALLLWLAMED